MTALRFSSAASSNSLTSSFFCAPLDSPLREGQSMFETDAIQAARNSRRGEGISAANSGDQLPSEMAARIAMVSHLLYRLYRCVTALAPLWRAGDGPGWTRRIHHKLIRCESSQAACAQGSRFCEPRLARSAAVDHTKEVQ